MLFFILIHKTHQTQTTSKTGTMSHESYEIGCRLLGRCEGGQVFYYKKAFIIITSNTLRPL